MTTTAEARAITIRAESKKRLTAIGRRLDELNAADDHKYSTEWQKKRADERAMLVREWEQIEASGREQIVEWSSESIVQAARLRAEHEIEVSARRGAANAEIADIALPFIGAPQRARNHLIPQARKFLALDMPDHADKILIAARRAGVDDTYLEQDIQAAWDRTVPSRVEAAALEKAATQQADLFDLDRYNLRLQHRVGDQIRSSNAAKMISAREGIPTQVGVHDVAPDGKAPVG